MPITPKQARASWSDPSYLELVIKEVDNILSDPKKAVESRQGDRLKNSYRVVVRNCVLSPAEIARLCKTYNEAGWPEAYASNETNDTGPILVVVLHSEDEE